MRLLTTRTNIDSEYGRHRKKKNHKSAFTAPTGNYKASLLHLKDLDNRGEQIDPDNAFWLVMKAAILYTLHQDEAADKALVRVSNMRYWRPYQNMTILAQFNIANRALGRRSAITELCELATTWNIGINEMLTLMSNVAISDAIQLEKEGHISQGLAIRHALIYLGGLIRGYSYYFRACPTNP